MRRITVFEREGTWRFSTPEGEHEGLHQNPLDAGIAAREFGETLRGHALGYVIRLNVAQLHGSDLGIALDTKVFSD